MYKSSVTKSMLQNKEILLCVCERTGLYRWYVCVPMWQTGIEGVTWYFKIFETSRIGGVAGFLVFSQ